MYLVGKAIQTKGGFSCHTCCWLALPRECKAGWAMSTATAVGCHHCHAVLGWGSQVHDALQLAFCCQQVVVQQAHNASTCLRVS